MFTWIVQWLRWAAVGCFLFLAASDAIRAEDRFFSGYIPTPADELAKFPVAPRYRAYLPAAVDLSKHMPKPGDQGALNSCVGWAVGYAARSYYTATVESGDLRKNQNLASPSFIYHAIRDETTCKQGSRIPDALRLLEDKGSLSLAEYPYSTSCRKLSLSNRAAAKGFKIDYWQLVDTKVIDDVKAQLAHGNPVVFAMSVGGKFLLHQGSGIYGGENRREGGHALTAIGYDDSKQALLVINSWGRRWGSKGFGWISYEAFTRNANEAYVMTVFGKVPDTKPSDEIPVAELDDDPEIPDVPEVIPVPKEKPQKLVVRPEPKPEIIPVTDAIKPDDCSLVAARRKGSRVELKGFVGTPDALEKLKRSHAGPGFDIDVDLRPWPQCEVLMTLAKALKKPDRPQLATASKRVAFKLGDELAIDLVAPKSPSYLYVSYVQADGSVLNLEQPAGPASPPARSAASLKFGDGTNGRPRFVISKPLGSEMFIAVAAASPLFDAPLPSTMTEREYLSALRKALIHKADPALPDREVAAAFLGLETKENAP